jgi:hypothetical protein
MPDGLIVEDDRLVGLRMRRTRMEDGRPQPTDETFEVRGPYIISSIGSIPLPIEGIPMKGELFDFVDWDLGRLEAFPTVFSTGNVATGKGNIIASRKHAKAVAETISESFLGLGDDAKAGAEAASEAIHAGARAKATDIAGEITRRPPLEAGVLDAIRAKVEERQREVGYDGLDAWLSSHTP